MGNEKLEYNYKLLPAKVTNVCNNLIVDAKLDDGQQVSAFCGALEVAKMCKPNMEVLLKRTSNSSRLVKYNVSFVKTPEGIIFANPKYNRILFKEAFEKRIIRELHHYKTCTPLKSRVTTNGLDFELTTETGEKAFVFVTSIYDKLDGNAVFPNNINFFEMKMLEEMKKCRDSGAKTYAFIIVPREDCLAAKFVWSLDPRAAAALFDAVNSGLNFICYGCKLYPNNIELNRKLDILY